MHKQLSGLRRPLYTYTHTYTSHSKSTQYNPSQLKYVMCISDYTFILSLTPSAGIDKGQLIITCHLINSKQCTSSEACSEQVHNLILSLSLFLWCVHEYRMNTYTYMQAWRLQPQMDYQCQHSVPWLSTLAIIQLGKLPLPKFISTVYFPPPFSQAT